MCFHFMLYLILASHFQSDKDSGADNICCFGHHFIPEIRKAALFYGTKEEEAAARKLLLMTDGSDGCREKLL